MTLGAHHALVHPAQRKISLIVIKLGHATDWLPSQRRVTVRARHVERSMRTSRLRQHLSLPPGNAHRKPHEKQIDQNGRKQTVHPCTRTLTGQNDAGTNA
jgi:hypothetical protein